MAKLVWRGPKALLIIRQGARDGVSSSAVIVQINASQLLNRQGTGRIYEKSGGRIHQASRPGEPPAKDLGNLGRSVQVDLSRLDERNPRAKTGTNVQYGRTLELGTRGIARRPWLSRALRESRDKIVRNFRQIMQRTVRQLRAQLRG